MSLADQLVESLSERAVVFLSEDRYQRARASADVALRHVVERSNSREFARAISRMSKTELEGLIESVIAGTEERTIPKFETILRAKLAETMLFRGQNVDHLFEACSCKVNDDDEEEDEDDEEDDED